MTEDKQFQPMARVIPFRSALMPEETLRSAQDSYLRNLFLNGLQAEEEENLEDAIESYARIIVLRSDHSDALNNLGKIYFCLGSFNKALAYWHRVTKRNPKYVTAWFNLANVYDELHRYDDAVMAGTKAIMLKPDYADAYYNLALAYEHLGQRQKALQYWRQYVRLDPVGPWADSAKSMMKKTVSSSRLELIDSAVSQG